MSTTRATQTAATERDWSLTFEDGVVTVELPATLELDAETGAAINEAFVSTLEREDVDGILTLLRVENPIGSGVFEAVQHAGDVAVDEGVSRWAVVVEERVKGMAFQSKLAGVETRIFEDETAAREFL